MASKQGRGPDDFLKILSGGHVLKSSGVTALQLGELASGSSPGTDCVALGSNLCFVLV